MDHSLTERTLQVLETEAASKAKEPLTTTSTSKKKIHISHLSKFDTESFFNEFCEMKRRK